MSHVLRLALFYRWGKWGPKVTQLVTGRGLGQEPLSLGWPSEPPKTCCPFASVSWGPLGPPQVTDEGWPCHQLRGDQLCVPGQAAPRPVLRPPRPLAAPLLVLLEGLWLWLQECLCLIKNPVAGGAKRPGSAGGCGAVRNITFLLGDVCFRQWNLGRSEHLQPLSHKRGPCHTSPNCPAASGPPGPGPLSLRLFGAPAGIPSLSFQGRFSKICAIIPISPSFLSFYSSTLYVKDVSWGFLPVSINLPCFPGLIHSPALFLHLFRDFQWEFWRQQSLIEGLVILNQIWKFLMIRTSLQSELMQGG